MEQPRTRPKVFKLRMSESSSLSRSEKSPVHPAAILKNGQLDQHKDDGEDRINGPRSDEEFEKLGVQSRKPRMLKVPASSIERPHKPAKEITV